MIYMVGMIIGFVFLLVGSSVVGYGLVENFNMQDDMKITHHKTIELSESLGINDKVTIDKLP